MNTWKRWLSLALCLVLCMGMLPVTARGAEAEQNGKAAYIEGEKLFYGDDIYWMDGGILLKNGELSEIGDILIRKIALMDETVYVLTEDDESWIMVDDSLSNEQDNIQLLGSSNNEQAVFDFSTNTLGVNTAVACGILANIYAESSFNPNSSFIEADGRTSYGICQWNNGRLDSLKSYCSDRGLDYTTLDAQLQFLQYELNGSEKSAFNKVKNVDDTADGAYMAGYNWAQWFERCASKYYEGRAVRARDVYWAKYGDVEASSALLLTSGTISEEQFATKIANLKSRYVEGQYWSWNNGTLDKTGTSKCNDSNTTCGGFYSPVSKTAKNNTGNRIAGQCYGYALRMAYEVFGSNYPLDTSSWEHKTSASEFYAGDHVRITTSSGGQHSIFLTSVDGSTITYTDCNSPGSCVVHWEKTITKSNLLSKFIFVEHLKGSTLKGTGTSPAPDVEYNFSSSQISGSSLPTSASQPADKGSSYYANLRIKSGTVNVAELYITPPGGSETRFERTPASGTGSYSSYIYTDNKYTFSQSGTYKYRWHITYAGNTKSIDKSGTFEIKGDAPDVEYNFSSSKISGNSLPTAASQPAEKGSSYYANLRIKSGTVNVAELYITPPGGSETRFERTPASGTGSYSSYIYTDNKYTFSQSGTYKYRWHITYAGNTKSIDKSGTFEIKSTYVKLNVNGYLDGQESSTIGDYGLFDVYVNGTCIDPNRNGCYDDVPVGGTYEIKNIRPSSGYLFHGTKEGSLTGTAGTSNINVRLIFRKSMDIGTGFYARIVSKPHNLALTNTDNQDVVAQTQSTGTNQIWYFERQSGGFYKIRSEKGGRYLDVYSSGNVSESNVHVHNDGDYDTMLWAIHKSSESGVYLFGVKSTESLLDINGASKNIHVYPDVDVSTQLFTIQKLGNITVTLNPNGGSVSPTSISASYGGTYSNLPTPARTGYTFAGWYTAASGGTQVTTSTKVTTASNHTLYAHWNSVAVTSVKLNKSSLTLVNDGSETLTATVEPSNATNKNITWTSSNTSVATVSDGKVTAVGTGTATITVKTADGGKTATCAVTVIPTYTLDLNGVLDGESNVRIDGFGTCDIYINGSLVSDDATDYFTSWTSGTAYEIKDIKAQSGYVYTGSITLKGTIGNDNVDIRLSFSTKDKYTLTLDANGGTVSPTGIKLTYGLPFPSIPVPARTGYTFAGWYTEKIGGIPITTLSTVAGNLTIYAHWTQNIVPVSGVSLNKTSLSLTVGDAETLTATVTPSDATDKAVTWTTSDPAVATVSSGVVTAVGAGVATITVTTVDGGKTASCTVNVLPDPAPQVGDTPLELVTSYSGGVVTVTVQTKEAIPSIAGYEMALRWNNRNLTVASIQKGNAASEIGTFTSNVSTAKISGGGDSNASLPQGAIFATYTFAEASLDEGEYPFTLTVNQAYCDDGGNLPDLDWCDQTVTGILKVTALSIEDFTLKSGLTASAIHIESNGSFTITNPVACAVVWARTVGGTTTYTILNAAPTETAGTCRFALPADFSGATDKLVVAVRGDITGDGTVNAKDATRFLQIAVETYKNFTELDILTADLTGDRALNAKDATRALQIAVESWTVSW